MCLEKSAIFFAIEMKKKSLQGPFSTVNAILENMK